MSRLCQTRQSISGTSHSRFRPPSLPLSSPTITRSAIHYSSVSLSLSVSSHPSLVQFFISGSIFLTSSQPLLLRHLALLFCLPLAVCHLCPPPTHIHTHTHFHKISKPCHMVSTITRHSLHSLHYVGLVLV